MERFFLIIALFALNTKVSFSQNALATRKIHLNLARKGLAIEGYDPVAYFKNNKATEGKKELAVNYEGAIYYFANADNKEAFFKNPLAYEPQYGGWCAYAMGKNGEKVSVDPETFKIINGKLYLFYNKFFNNTLTSWNKDETNLKKKADLNWQKIFR
ncbi:MAG TPA: YHS domain-containing (seleno)protein [Chitinophagaceae bacterium]